MSTRTLPVLCAKCRARKAKADRAIHDPSNSVACPTFGSNPPDHITIAVWTACAACSHLNGGAR